MSGDNPNGNLFMKQVSKMFEDLSAKPAGQSQPANPRITCTRLRRLREIRRELVLDPDSESDNESATAGQASNKACGQEKSESFADWVLRNQHSHQHFVAKPEVQHEETKVATNREASKIVHEFANFSSAALQKVAKNPRTPISTLKLLAAHYRVEVRQALAGNENIDVDILNILLNDSVDMIREALLDNKNIAREHVLRLCDDQSPLVAEKAKNLLYNTTKSEAGKRQSMTVTANMDVCVPSQAQSGPRVDKFGTQESIVIEREFLALIAERSTTPPRRLAELAVHPDATIRCLVAGNSNATEEIFWQLAKDPLSEVRSKLLGNYNCPAEIIEYLHNAS